ncbi:programmed cell death protein [Nowakowskiella sp. JEL0078]|nr:programmed cell death protein [Nowakowskiella sp. JEL0078]
MNETLAQLGFAEEISSVEEFADDVSLLNFPSKIGGFPFWLIPDCLPSVSLICSACSDPLFLLLQVGISVSSFIFSKILQLYTPDDLIEDSYHRCVYLFICNSLQCRSSKELRIKALHQKSPKIDPFTSTTSKNPHSKTPNACVVCNSPASKHCAKCISRYCSRSHQVLHWSHGHKASCGSESDQPIDPLLTSLCSFPLFEIVIDDEPVADNELHYPSNDDESIDSLQTDKQKIEQALKMLNKQEKILPEEVDGTFEPESDDDESPSDELFDIFQKRVSRDPLQVLRYARTAEGDSKPLVISVDSDEVEKCQGCGESYVFEFQVMPHMLNLLPDGDKKDGLDFGTLLVFSCKKNCRDDGFQIKRQDFS